MNGGIAIQVRSEASMDGGGCACAFTGTSEGGGRFGIEVLGAQHCLRTQMRSFPKTRRPVRVSVLYRRFTDDPRS